MDAQPHRESDAGHCCEAIAAALALGEVVRWQARELALLRHHVTALADKITTAEDYCRDLEADRNEMANRLRKTEDYAERLGDEIHALQVRLTERRTA